MRFNSTELKQFAISSVSDKEGVLSLREKEGKLWKKTDVLTERWCKLVGNLLFYMKGKSKSSEPSGVFVLEKFKVTNSVDEPSFVVEFHSDQSTYFLASNQTEARDWSNSLQKASCSYLKDKYYALRQSVETLREKVIVTEPVLEISLKCSDLKKLVSVSTPSTMISVHHCEPSHGFWTPHSQTDVVHDSAEPTFLTTVCFQQTDDVILTSRLRFIVYRIKKPSTNSVEEIGSAFCVFGDLWRREKELELHLHHEGSYAGRLHLLVVRSGKLKQLEEEAPKFNKSGKVVVPVDQSLAASVKQNNDQALNFDHNSLFQAMYCNPTTRTYRFPTDTNDQISVQELMLETKLSFHIPIAYLKLCINEETRKVGSYEMLNKLTAHWDSVRQRRLETCKKYLERYNARMKHLMLINKSPYFKKSVDKTVEDLEFVATNLHLQRLRVHNSKFIRQDSTTSSSEPQPEQQQQRCAEYDFVTVGAATAHSMGYKQGGLLSQLTNADEGGKSKKSLPLHPIAHCLRRNTGKADHLLATVVGLEKQIAYQIEKLRNLVSQVSDKRKVDLYSGDKVTASHEALANLSTKTCEFVTYLDSEELTTSVLNLASARPTYRPLYDSTQNDLDTNQHVSSVLVNGDSNVASFNRMSVHSDADLTPEMIWEDTKLSVKSTLAEVVKSVTGIITPQLEAGFLRGGGGGKRTPPVPQHATAMDDLTKLRNLVTRSCDEATASITFQELSLADVGFQNELSYRRKVVFCQALSSCVCGVATAFASSINNEIIFNQYAQVGILFQVESLVSTYGNELGMLQDYAVGVMDLLNVSFKLVRASQQHHLAAGDPVLPDHLLPVLKGNTESLTVILPLDDVMFMKLPRQLKQGSLIKVHPVIYNIGINEEQTLAERFGNTSLQEYLNMEALQRTLSYYDSVRDSCPNCINEQLRSAGSFLRDSRRKSSASPVANDETESQRSIMDLMNSLSQSVRSKKSKNVEVLQLSSDLVRRLNGVRVTSCKSAKDRTAMAVTLEEVRILTNEHRLSRNMFNSVLSCLRSEGTRRENTLKNVGARRYAFTSVQLMTFPKFYRAPEGTYGKGDT